MRRVAQEAGVRVVGINSSEVQLKKAKELDAEAGIGNMIDYLACSFMDMGTIADDTFDRGYAIESTCHAPDKTGAFTEIHRVLKPGALFWGQEMCMTDEFDPDDRRHQGIKQELMQGIALKDIATFGEVNRALGGGRVRDHRGQGSSCRGSESQHVDAVVSAYGVPAWNAGQRLTQNPTGPKGVDRDV